MSKLKEATQRGDSNEIISFLIDLRKLSKCNKIDSNTFESLIDLIKVTNPKIINYALSILANCCSSNNYRTMFKKMGGVPHLLLVVRSIDNDSIVCRASRLLGNLAVNSDLARELYKNNAVSILLELLKREENMSSDTALMVFRALKKLWTVAEYKWKMLPDDLLPTFNKCLNSKNEQIVYLAVETLIMFTNFKKLQKNDNFKVSEDLFQKLIELSEKAELNSLTTLCLSNLICYQSLHIWSYLEGSNITEVFINFIQNVDDVDGVVYRAFFKLCTESAVRSKVRKAGLLPKLIEKCNSVNVKKIVAIFYLFQHDLSSMMVCSQNQKFTSILIENILIPGSVQLLAVLSRLSPPVKELVLIENLEVLIKNKQCIGILKNITRTKQFLKPLLTSGKVWEIEKAGCSMEEIGCFGHSEGLIVHLLISSDKKCREDVSLAIPFLVKPRNFELLYKFLAHYQVITTILNLLNENPVEERILATVIRLINIFKHNYHKSGNFFQDFGDYGTSITSTEICSSVILNNDVEVDKLEMTTTDVTDSEIITFELDNGSSVDINKILLCQNSPVFDSMLNGYFMEAKQKKVRLRQCSREALLYLGELLNKETDFSEIRIELYLELLSLTDRFLLITLNNTLTENLKIDEISCPYLYQWYRKAGYTKNNAIIRQRIYEFLFSSSEYLLLVMKDDSCRSPLIKEISDYLSNSLADLL